LSLPFTHKQLPTAEELESAHFAELILQAKRAEDEISSETKNLVNALLEHEQRDLLIALLLHNTTQVIPELRSNSRRGRGKGDRRERDDRDSYESSSRSDNYEKYDREDRRDNRPMTPPKKDARIYLGQGTADALTEEWLRKALNGEEGASFERITLRDKYGFVDFPEEASEEVLTKLKDLELPNGDKVFACKATLISAPRGEQSDEDQGEQSNSSSDEEGSASESEASLTEEGASA
ncbi:MAG: DbpA RNA binding domain-containing protein, partial [Bdellovibrionales bacterium]|nr:DbpA RNA binding domain-containing protein [Bdellovibrionales bacterium]